MGGNEKTTFSGYGIEELSSGISHRQSFCEQNDAMLKDPSIHVEHALNGAHLNVLLYYEAESGHFNYDEETGIDPINPGILADILDYVAERTNITWRNSFGITAEDRGNVTFNELLQWGTETYDIYVGDWARSSERRNLGIDFCDPFYDGDIILVRKVNPEQWNHGIVWLNWIIPFEKEVWWVIIATLFLSGFTYQIIEYITNERGDRTLRRWTMDHLYLSFINFTQNYAHEPTTLGGRIFAFFFAFWAMLIGAAYTANLASLLVDRSTNPLVINNIRDVINNGLILCTHSSSVSESIIKAKYPNIIPLLVPRATELEMYNALNLGECDVLLGAKQSFEVFEHKEEFNKDCDLVWEGRVVKHIGKSFATMIDPGTLCSSLVNEVFNFYLSEMSDSGLLAELWDKHNQQQATLEKSCDASSSSGNGGRRLLAAAIEENNSFLGGEDVTTTTNHRYLKSGGRNAASSSSSLTGNDDKESERLSLTQMAGTFMLLAVGSLVAICVTFASSFEKKKNIKRQVKKKSRRQLSSIAAATGDGSLGMTVGGSSSFHNRLDALDREVNGLDLKIDAVLSLLQSMKDSNHNDSRS